MSHVKSKLLLVGEPSSQQHQLVDGLDPSFETLKVASASEAIERIKQGDIDGVYLAAGQLVPFEAAFANEQAGLILNTIGEGVCLVDGAGKLTWTNRKMSGWPSNTIEKVRRTCQHAFALFAHQVSPQVSPSGPDKVPAPSRSKRYPLNIDDQQYLEMIVSPVVAADGKVTQVVAVIWDATGTRRLQQKIDTIDRAGRELVRLEGEALSKMNVGQRLKLLEEKIVGFTRELMHFDHFIIRLLDRRTNKLELVITTGLPQEALNIDLFADKESNGISGYVAATGMSYICADVQADPRYVPGLDQARSSLTVPLRLHDKVIGIFNIESRQTDAFNEDDRQFAEIFGRYVAIALNILDLMVVERVSTMHKVSDDVCSEIAGPLNDISLDVTSMMEDFIGNEDVRKRLSAVLDNVGAIQKSLRQAVSGPQNVLGAGDHKVTEDPILAGARVLVADDEPNIRLTISEILRKYHADVTVASCALDAIARIGETEFDLIISDIKMPDKTGYDVFAAARKRNTTIPVILMTGFGYDPHHSIVRASQEGLSAVLFKPFRVEQLLTEVRKALQATALQSTAAKAGG